MFAVIGPEQCEALFRYFGALPDLLRRKYRNGPVLYPFRGHPGVKDAIETMGVPHTEVDAILANGHSVDFTYPLQHGDLIEVYPVFTPVPVTPYLNLSAVAPLPALFVIDVHLGKLTRRLRLLGFDCLYHNDYTDHEIMQVSRQQERIILTRDLGILKHRQIVHGYLVRSGQVDEQVREVLTRYRLYGQIKPWRRCLHCNGLLKPVTKASIQHQLELKTRLFYNEFDRCAMCGHIYWHGSHYEKMARWIETILDEET